MTAEIEDDLKNLFAKFGEKRVFEARSLRDANGTTGNTSRLPSGA
jgi:hypothetical protein